jgi:streptogramin lyase
MFFTHSALRLLTGSLLMLAFQTLFAGNTVQCVPGRWLAAGVTVAAAFVVGAEVAAGAAATPAATVKTATAAYPTRRLMDHVSAASPVDLDDKGA